MSPIYLVRHGRTPLNAAGVLRGHLDPELDRTGLAEAMALGDALGPHRIGLVVSSPLRRAVGTATPIAVRAGVEVQVDRRLIDRDYGPWAGRPAADVIAHWGSIDGAPDVEPRGQVLARSMDVMNEVALRRREGSAVAVSHDAVIQLLLPLLDPRVQDLDPISLETGSFTVIEHVGGNWSVESINNKPPGPGSPVSSEGLPT